MNHDQGADHTCGHAPGGLVHILKGIILIRELDVKRLCKTIPKVVAGPGLKGLAVMHQGLNGIGRLCAREFLLVRLLALDDRDCQHFLTEICIYIQHLDGSCLGFLGRCMGCMAFLPQKLPGTQEGTGCFLPAHNRTPLVVYPWQIAVGMDIL